MATDIDSLQIEISASASRASTQIDKLISSLNNLKSASSGLSGLSQLSSTLQTIGNAKVTGLSSLAKQINQLGSMDTSKITQMKTAMQEFGDSMQKLNGITVSGQTAQMVELARAISLLGAKSSTVAITNMPQLASGLSQMMTTLSRAPKVSQNLIDMTNALARFARTGSSGVKAANSLSTSVSSMGSKFAKVPSSLKSFNVSLKNTVASMKQIRTSILSALGVVGGIYGAISGIKKALEVRSDVTEAQNVIDVTFGQYKDLVEEMSETSIQDYGISELAVKNTAGRFQAMGTAAGIARDEMAEMSVALTGLSADMASFYNKDQDEVATSLQSVFSGETEPLRKYGIDLTQATMQEWLNKKGIDAKISSMSQAEKIMLRYEYVMERSSAAQGDFARTSGTWANQVRILKEQLSQLASVLGTAFINVLKPLVSALNSALSSIIEFAVKVVNALGAIFGWKAVVSGAGIADEYSTAASGAEDVADSTGTAAGNAGKLAKNVAKAVRSFDELKTISISDSSSGGSGSGSGGGSGSGSGGGSGVDDSSVFDIVETENPFVSSIKDLESLGKAIRDVLIEQMDGIDWESIYSKASAFGTGLAQFLNGLFAGEKGKSLFGEFGNTLAGALNTVIEAVFSFSEEFRWSDFGKSLKQGIQNFLDKAHFEKAGFTAGSVASGIATSVYEIVRDKSTWSSLGAKLSEGINGFFDSMARINISTGKNGWQTMGASFTGISVGLLTAIKEALDGVKWQEVGSSMTEYLQAIDYGEILYTAIKASVSLINAAAGFAEGLKNGFDVQVIKDAIAEKLKGMSLWDVIKEYANTYADVNKIFTNLIPNGGFGKLFNTVELVTQIKEVRQALALIEAFDFSKWWSQNVAPYFDADTWKKMGNTIKNSVVTSLNSMISEWKTKISSWWTSNVKPYFTADKWSGIASGIKQGISSKWNDFKTWWDKSALSVWLNDFKNKLSTDNLKSKIGSIQSAFNSKWSTFMSWWNDTASTNWLSKFENAFSQTKLGSKIGSIKAAFKAKWDDFKSWWSNLEIKFPKIKMPKISIEWDTKEIFGQNFKYPKGFNVDYYAAGGFPTQGSLFFAGERGAEMLGSVGGKTAVAGGAEITGIKDAINNTSQREIVLMSQQNQLLQALLQKDTGITKNDIGKAAREYAQDQYYKTGRSVFVF